MPFQITLEKMFVYQLHIDCKIVDMRLCLFVDMVGPHYVCISTVETYVSSEGLLLRSCIPVLLILFLSYF